MKKILYLSLILLVKTAFCQTDMLTRRFPKETIGETYIMLDKNGLIDFYARLYKTDDPDEKRLKFAGHEGLKLKLVQIDKIKDYEEHEIGRFVDSAGNKYSSEMTHSQFYAMVPQSEVENAQKIYSGKYVWTNPSVVPSPKGVGLLLKPR